MSSNGGNSPMRSVRLSEGDITMQFGDEFMQELFFPNSIADCCFPPNSINVDCSRPESSWSQSLREPSVSWDWDEIKSPVGLRDRTWSYMTGSTSSSYCASSTLSLIPGEMTRTKPEADTSPIHSDTLLEIPMGWRHTSVLNRRQEVVSRDQHDLITPAEVRTGNVDIQGIPWLRFSISRDDYRQRRMAEYSNYNNVLWTAQLEHLRRKSIVSPTTASCRLFRFKSAFRKINPSIDHFQLRQLLWSTSNNESFYVSNSCLYQFNSLTDKVTKVHSQTQNQMACSHVLGDIAASGAFDSEVIVSTVREGKTLFRRKISAAENSITNHVAVFVENGPKVLAANNDQILRELDVAREGKVVQQSVHPWPVNHGSVSPDNKLICLAGDNCDLALIDRKTNSQVGLLKGHLDYSFCSEWLGHYVGTGSQDGTCRVWDSRNVVKPVKILGSLLGAVRSLKFSPDGSYLAFGEPADFVHIYDVREDYSQCQVVDFFGNIAGIAFTPDSSRLMASVSDSMFGCLMEFRRLGN